MINPNEMTVSDIKKIIEDTDVFSIEDVIKPFLSDERSGVKAAVKKGYDRLDKYKKELLRTDALKEYERKYEEYTYICGIDEVGRGPFAGPVVACGVILPKDCDILFINDSKKLSEKKREELYDEIIEKALAVGIGMEDNHVIDEINILKATYSAMRKAISSMKIRPTLLLNDAVTIPGIDDIKQIPIVKGDAKSISIGAASIVAKVYRDRLMCEYAKKYPQYGFEKNKGYGSAEHIEALRKYGPTEIHRKTFIHSFVN